MPDSLAEQIEKLRTALSILQSRRPVLGEGIEPAIAATQRELEALLAQVPAPPDERRVISIFFSDVVGSVSLAGELDPEDWRALLGTVQHKIGSIVAAHGGMVAQYQGDGLMAFFGAQGLREEDVEQAIRAALEAQVAIPQLNLQVPVQIRIGIHTGLVLLGAWGADSKIEFGAFGDPVNVAARLQSYTSPGTVIISQDTYQYVRGAFELEPLAPVVLKGKNEPLQTYVVLRTLPRAFQGAARGVLDVQTPTIGREVELEQLRAAYLDAYMERRVEWTLLTGDPGVGKSRLMREMNDWIKRRPEQVIEFRGGAAAGEKNQPFALVRRMWFDLLQIAEDAPLATAEAQWVQRFKELTGIPQDEPAHALGLLLGLEFQASPYLAGLRHNPQQLRGRAAVVSRDALRALLSETMVVCLIEDLHWADASSLEYLQEVLSPSADGHDLQGKEPGGVFVLATARTEWQGISSPLASNVNLGPLEDTASRELAHALLSKVDNVPADLVDLVVRRSEGVPYYAEELVNYLLDRGIIDRSSEPWHVVASRLNETPLPATLAHLLRARIDGLSLEDRHILQRGAVYGRNFWSAGVDALGAGPSELLLRGLEPRGLVEHQSESALQGESEWSFHHALLRDVTYESVLKRQRPALHSKAAGWLADKARVLGRLDEFAGMLGEHCERGGEAEVAASWYVRAGERANRQAARQEAKNYFDSALSLLSPDMLELRWRALLGRETALGRLGEREMQFADIRALGELAELFDDEQRRAVASYCEARYRVSKGELRLALTAAEQTLTAAHRAGDAALEASALASMVTNRTRLGESEMARALVVEASSRAREANDDFVLAQTLMQIGVHYTDAGDLADAVAPFTEAAEIAQRIGDRGLEGQILSNLGYAYAQLGLYELASPALERTLQLAETMGEKRDYAYGLQNLGWTYLCSGDSSAARWFEEQALVEFAAMSDAFGRTYCHLYLGHIAEREGHASDAAKEFNEAQLGFNAIGMRGAEIEAVAGLARCALAQDQLAEAGEFATSVWEHLTEHRTRGIEQPALVYRTCADIFEAMGNLETSSAATEAGYRELMTRAEKISNPEWRKSFLENVAEHRALVEMWERVSPAGS